MAKRKRVRPPATGFERLSYDRREAADITGITEWRMYQLLTTGVIPSFRISGKMYVLRNELLRWLEMQSGTKLST